MKFLDRLLEPYHHFKINPNSLRVRLTVGVATVSALGLGSVAVWISWKMETILIQTHKQNIRYISDRFPNDVEIYSDMITVETGLQKAVDNLTDGRTLLWVKNPQGKITAQSMPLKMGTNGTNLVSLTQIFPYPDLQLLNGRYWLLCSNLLTVKGVNLGRVYIAQDITDDQTMFFSLLSNLSIATAIAIGVMTVTIAWYVRRSLQPLKRISQLTQTISAEQLGDARFQLDNAPGEVKELARTFEQMLTRLSDAWEHQRQLVSDVSHELRTPLTIVSGYLQSTLRRGSNLTPTQREALEIAGMEADRTIKLLQDLLNLARVDSGQMHFKLESINLNDWLTQVKSKTEKYSDRQINWEIPPNLIIIKADPDRLLQVLYNLIDNAIKYSDPQTPITVKLDRQQQAIIQVCDRGVGIPLQDQARIFERFYRVDETRSRSTGGTGLGLSIVKTFVEGMGGNISVSSQPGKGSVFSLTFPLLLN
ncbi:integral membrane sensor signal transduction histidine kinase [Gloeothece citriformis PCC 7424]|uniref:histidine kinase n=1 Tax=Gloeothece citriformis (strain PCC 7424) TaxID=65393 RepID=B7KLA1_GLOC7|nr:HAMP domain-containing sensor histidine kinase [Gloeothece citriformis]ACK72473.1 integral membrane sensor signal transduction histidine kinase [Gloeothece citriformis PCC 7424]